LNVPLRLPELWSALPAWFASAWDPAAPWAVLGAPLDAFLDSLPSQAIESALQPDVHLVGDRIVIGKGARIAPAVVLEGPLWLGEDVEIRTGAYVRGGCWIGDGCRIGANTEVKRSILLPEAKAPHLNYVGDSILGRDVNLGAGTVLSNFRHDGREIVVLDGGARIATGRRKLGALLGDGVKTGCNSVLHPGVIVGRDTEIYPLVQLRAGVYPPRSIVKLKQELEIVPKR
jgi:UDP-N-acetylglucosamine diphosphorylase / glucose-1-phosphate thymidylyltransferase / UDP-N-acetylgalactosamine diphosphorylase / glucosamine-1-phosphate N-acetyltransferase / galactosamine-1-phosphate N-acetyltransferase